MDNAFDQNIIETIGLVGQNLPLAIRLNLMYPNACQKSIPIDYMIFQYSCLRNRAIILLLPQNVTGCANAWEMEQELLAKIQSGFIEGTRRLILWCVGTGVCNR